MDTALKEIFPRSKQVNVADFKAVVGPRGYISMQGVDRLNVVVDIKSTKTQHVVEQLLAKAKYTQYTLTNDGEYSFILRHEESKLARALIGQNGRR